MSKWWDIESYASNCDVTGHSKEEERAIKTLEQTTRFNGERYEVGLLWREDEVKLPNNFYSAIGQLKSLGQCLQKDETVRKRYQETIDTDVNAGYVRKVDQAELNETKDKLQWYLPHHPVINPHKPDKVRRVCNAAANYQGVALNDKLISEPNLLQILIGIIFCFRELQIALSADIEAMFLQEAVPNDDSQCLQFLWREDPEQTLNARPLTAVSDDPEDLTALTPNHFSLGRENASAPFMPFSERYHDLGKSFKTAQAYADMIWKRWTREYLPQWNQRSKWSKEHVRNLKEGELVWLVDDAVKPCEYKLGQIIEIFTGNDGVVRSARLKMAHGVLNRPVVKLAPVFYDGFSEIENRAGDVGATSNQLQKPSDSKK